MNIEFANRLTELRKQHDLSQEALAAKLGVSRQAVSKWENGESAPDTDNLIALADLYGISLDELLGKKPAEKETPVEEAVGEVVDEDEAIVRAHEDDDDPRAPITRMAFARKLMASVGTLIAVIAYLLMGFLWKGPSGNLGWACGWVVFLIPMFLVSVLSAIEHRRPTMIQIALLVVGVYCCTGIIGNAYGQNFWHPYWVEFFLIPIFYSAFGLIERTKQN